MTWDESKHPRNPHTGEFTDVWIRTLSDLIDKWGLPDLPASGIKMQAREVVYRADRWTMGGYNDRKFSGFEFWDPNNEGWRSGVSLRVGMSGETLVADDELSRGTVSGRLEWTQHAPIWMRLSTGAGPERVEPEADAVPDPEREYLVGDVWVSGSKIKVNTVLPGVNLARGAGQHPVRPNEWIVDHPGSNLHGLSPREWNPTTETYMVRSRPHVPPPELFHRRPGHPDERMRSFDGAHILLGQDLLDTPGLTQGGFQIYNEQDKTWHTIEEVYQNFDDNGMEEQDLEVVADGLHLPFLGISDEITVRPTPIDY